MTARDDFDRVEILGRLRVVERGEYTRLERHLIAALERISDADGSNEPTWWGSSTSHLRSIARDALAARSPSRTKREAE